MAFTYAWRTGQVALAVAAVGLNFRDVLNVLGLYPGDPGAPGGDCAGTVTAVGRSVRHSYRCARHHQTTADTTLSKVIMSYAELYLLHGHVARPGIFCKCK